MKGRRNKLKAFHHYVWATYDRLPLVTEEIEREVYRSIESVCREAGCEVLAVGGMPDHVHLLVLISTRVSISELMQRVKGGSSRLVTKTLKPGEWFAWQRHYAVYSVSMRDRNRVIAYIQNQKRHHTEGTLWPEAEETCEVYEVERGDEGAE